MSQLAPIVLFTYLRLEALQNTVNALAQNFGAADSELFIFSDGAKYPEDEQKVKEIRTYLKSIKGFKSVVIYESKTNKGLANSIIDGISSILKVYPSAIILEDDLLTSKNFLTFMNRALVHFENSKDVISITGYSFDFKHSDMQEDAYFLNRTWTWGWATWADRWNAIDWELNQYQIFENNAASKAEFSKLGSDVNQMLKRQMNHEIDSWGIRFIYNQFIKKGLTLYPKVSKVENIGFDNFATHTVGLKNRFETKIDSSDEINFIFPNNIEVSTHYQTQFLRKFGFFNRFLNKILEFFLL